MKRSYYRLALLIAGSFLCSINSSFAQKKKSRDHEVTSYHSVRIYHYATLAQEKAIDQFLGEAFIPSLHQHSLGPIGVFKPIANDTAADKKIVVISSAATVDKLLEMNSVLEKDTSYIRLAAPFVDASYNAAPFVRYETVLLQSFPAAH